MAQPPLSEEASAIEALLAAAEYAAPYLIGRATEKPAKAYLILMQAIRKLRRVQSK